jgi:hypothetical protein
MKATTRAMPSIGRGAVAANGGPMSPAPRSSKMGTRPEITQSVAWQVLTLARLVKQIEGIQFLRSIAMKLAGRLSRIEALSEHDP